MFKLYFDTPGGGAGGQGEVYNEVKWGGEVIGTYLIFSSILSRYVFLMYFLFF